MRHLGVDGVENVSAQRDGVVVQRSIGTDRNAITGVTRRKMLHGGWIEGNLIEPDTMRMVSMSEDVGHAEPSATRSLPTVARHVAVGTGDSKKRAMY